MESGTLSVRSFIIEMPMTQFKIYRWMIKERQDPNGTFTTSVGVEVW